MRRCHLLFSLAHVPDGNVWRDAGADKPAKELTRAVGSIGSKIFGLEPHPLVGSLDHRLSRSDLVIGSGRRGSGAPLQLPKWDHPIIQPASWPATIFTLGQL